MHKTMRYAWLALLVTAVVGLHGRSGAAQSASASAGMPIFQPGNRVQKFILKGMSPTPPPNALTPAQLAP